MIVLTLVISELNDFRAFEILLVKSAQMFKRKLWKLIFKNVSLKLEEIRSLWLAFLVFL